MTTTLPSLRINRGNPNHHLFRNNGRIWWLHYTLHLPDYTVRRVRLSLGTADVGLARERRDANIQHLLEQANASRPQAALNLVERRAA
jgi:hypothetical protein